MYAATKRTDWVISWPGQDILDYICALVHLEGPRGPQTAPGAEQYDIVKMVRGELNKQNRTTLGALVVLDVHARDVLAILVKESESWGVRGRGGVGRRKVSFRRGVLFQPSDVTSETDFQWLSQLQYYWEEENMMTRMINSKLAYGYEYLGNSGVCMCVYVCVIYVCVCVCVICVGIFVNADATVHYLEHCICTWGEPLKVLLVQEKQTVKDLAKQ